MGSEKDEWLLKVPDDLKKKLDELAEKKNLTGRAPWAICARILLAEALEAGA